MKIKYTSDFKISLNLYGLEKNLISLINLYNSKNLPKVLMMSGKKGVGKSTLTNHFLNYIYDQKNYDLNKFKINSESKFNKQYSLNVFDDLFYLSGDIYKNVKVNDIRDLKSKLLKSSISNLKRFIILDDVELFNTSSLNSLLKLIEEPTPNNYFILIYNKSRPILETLYSRSIDFKIFLKEEQRIEIIERLILERKLNVHIDYKCLSLTPGNFILFNKICEDNEINFDNNYLKNIETLLNLYKKNKTIDLINLILFCTDLYYFNLKEKKNKSIDIINNEKTFVTENINKFLTFNINQKSLLSTIGFKLTNE